MATSWSPTNTPCATRRRGRRRWRQRRIASRPPIAVGLHPDWSNAARPRIPAELLDTLDRNVDARRALNAITPARTTLPAWRIVPPAPADQLLGFSSPSRGGNRCHVELSGRDQSCRNASGKHRRRQHRGRAGTHAVPARHVRRYGQGGDIHSPHDSIIAAGRYLAANNFVNDRDHAIYRYNHASDYVRAVNQYAALIGGDPAAFAGYYRWDVYCRTTAGDVLLPIGYVATAPIPVADYVATHPQ